MQCKTAASRLEQLPEASLLQSSDVVHSLERGVALGGATGLGTRG